MSVAQILAAMPHRPIQHASDASGTLVTVDGELDAANADQLASYVSAMSAAPSE